MSSDILVLPSEKLQPSKRLQKKYGLVFFEGADLSKLDNRALQILLGSEIVVTTNDIKPQDIYTKLVELSKKDDEKSENERTLSGILESIILFIRKNDFDRLQKPIEIKIKPMK